MATFVQFAANMRRLADKVERNAPRIQRLAAGAVLQGVVNPTPVKSGLARSNWLVGLGAAREGTVPTYGTNAAGAAIQTGLSRIAAHNPGQAIHLTNNVAYIGELNRGTSAQAPAGFVQAGVQAGVEAVRGQTLLS